MTCAADTIFLALLTILNYFVGKRRILYPPLIYSFVWFADAALFWYAPIKVNEVHSITWWVIALGALVFSIGGWLTRLVPRAVIAKKVRELSRPAASRLGRVLLLSICALAVPIMLHDVAQRGTGANGTVLEAARQSYVHSAEEGEARNPLINNLPLFSICVTIICLIEGRDKFFWIALLLSLACCILTTGRTFVLQLLSAVAAALMLEQRKDDIKGLLTLAVIPFLLFVSLFIGLIFVNKDVSNFQGDNGAILKNFVLAYLVSPLPALDYVLTHPSEYAHTANHTFGFLSSLFDLAGFNVGVPQGLDTPVFVPLPTNVYTVYKFFFTDFGLFGMFVPFVIIGFLQTLLYRRAVAGGKVSLLLCVLLVFPPILSIFDDAYGGSGLLFLLKAAFLAVLYFGILSRLQLGVQLPRVNSRMWAARRGEI